MDLFDPLLSPLFLGYLLLQTPKAEEIERTGKEDYPHSVGSPYSHPSREKAYGSGREEEG